MKMKIGVVSAHPGAEKSFGNLLTDTDDTIIFRVGYLDKAYEHSLELQNEVGVDAIITLGIPMEVFDSAIKIPIYPILPNSYDILLAIYQGLKIGKKPAFVAMPLHSELYDLDRIEEILGFHFMRYRFSAVGGGVKGLNSIINQAVLDGADVIVTMGGYSHSYTQSIGIASILIMPEQQSLRSTLEHVQNAFYMRIVETEKARWLNAVFDNETEGVLVLDNEERVVVANTAAQKFMRIDINKVVGQDVGTIALKNPLLKRFYEFKGNLDIVRGNTREYTVRKEPLYADEDKLGTVFRVNPVKELQRLELDARRKIYKSGFVADATFRDINGDSKIFLEVKRQAKKYAKSRSNIILYGESGSGKEIFAQSIHNASPNANGPFVAINCTVLSDALLESELFGYEEGAFTGAKKGGNPGLFELAHGGTFLLDEIGDMPANIQVKLLRVLQERNVRRIGGSRNIPIDVRFVFATNKDLQKEVDLGNFRSDLFFRINVLPLKIPPLRARKKDIAVIAKDIAKKLCLSTNTDFILSDQQLTALERYDWPGNVRELGNFLERLCILQDDNTFDYMMNELLRGKKILDDNIDPEFLNNIIVKTDTLHNMENAIIKDLYEKNAGNRAKIKETLDISTSTLFRRLKEMGYL